MWEVEATDAYRAWYETLNAPELSAVNAAVEKLMEIGPGIRRPLVGQIKGSRHPHMRELIVPYRNLRVLFIFDPRRIGILLVGGDKTDRWQEWYDQNVRWADALYDEYLEELGKEGLL